MIIGKWDESVAGMKKHGLCGELIHRLAALCLPPGDGEARYWFANSEVKMRRNLGE